jgi:hypothetical protein
VITDLGYYVNNRNKYAIITKTLVFEYGGKQTTFPSNNWKFKNGTQMYQFFIDCINNNMEMFG